MPASHQLYLNVLGLGANASVDEIKKAYRHRAKMFHPDVNKEPNAHEKFVLINEAYEYLLNEKSGKFTQVTKVRNKEWEVQQARARAAEHARMRYEAFTQTEYYKSTASIADALDILISIAGLIVFVLITWIAYRQNGVGGLLSALLIDVLGISILYMVAKNTREFSFSRYIDSLGYLARWRYFHLTLLSLLNLWVFFNIGFNTFISLSALALAYLIFPILFFLILRLLGKQKQFGVQTFGFIPALISLLLVINYTFTSAPVEETYRYQLTRYDGDSESTIIYLDNDFYDEFVGIRTFFNFGLLTKNNTITYSTAQGVLGLKVVKHERFSMDYKRY